MFLSKTLYPLLKTHPNMTEKIDLYVVKNQNKLNRSS